jgi:hypothetical protein
LPVSATKFEPGLIEFEAGLLTRERHRLRIFENREFRRIFGCKRYKQRIGENHEKTHNMCCL